MKFVVIRYDEDLVYCLRICEDYYNAVGIAYDYACTLIEDNEGREKGSVTPLYDLEGQTGLGLTVTYGDGPQRKVTVFILTNKDEGGDG